MSAEDILKYYKVPETNLSEYESWTFMKTRTDVLNHLADKYKLKRYLEIGVQNPAQNFDKIRCEYKVSVDPDPNAHASFCMTSDEFFDTGFDKLYVNEAWETKFDLVFIDGMHTAKQVQKDFTNALNILSPNGFIILHDCNPEKEEHTIVPRPTPTGHWNGDVVKFVIRIRQYGYTVDIDNGCFVYRNTPDNYNNILPEKWERKYLNTYRLGFVWSIFNENRKEQLHLISWDEFIKL